MFLYVRQYVGQHHDTKMANKSLDNVAEFTYACTGKTLTNLNCLREEIRRILNSVNTCCHLVQNLLYSCLISKNV